MKKTTYYVWGLGLFGFLLACLAYPQATNDIAIHWNAQGNIDSYAPKWCIFLLPFIVPFLDVFLSICRHMDPKRENYTRFENTYELIRILLASFTFLFFIVAIVEIYRPGLLDIEVLPICILGILISSLGNLMPKVKPNFFIGMRTPWTLKNETVWIKTHRVAGRTWFVGGFLFFFMALAPHEIANLMPYVITILIVIYPVVYSYLIYHKLMKKGEQYD